MDLTGQTWQYVRIYADAGSGAAGQVAHIAALGNGFIEIDWVWNTTSRIVGPPGGDHHMEWILRRAADSGPTWFVNPRAGDRYVLAEGTRFWVGGTPALVTVEEVLNDVGLRDLNTIAVQTTIDVVKAQLDVAAGGPGTLTFVPVPALYFGVRTGFDTGRSAGAFTPGLANFQVIGGNLYFPRQFGPRCPACAGDLFETVTAERLPNALFVDDWDLYHRLLGEVHCGSVVKREALGIDWWAYP